MAKDIDARYMDLKACGFSAKVVAQVMGVGDSTARKYLKAAKIKTSWPVGDSARKNAARTSHMLKEYGKLLLNPDPSKSHIIDAIGLEMREVSVLEYLDGVLLAMNYFLANSTESSAGLRLMRAVCGPPETVLLPADSRSFLTVLLQYGVIESDLISIESLLADWLSAHYEKVHLLVSTEKLEAKLLKTLPKLSKQPDDPLAWQMVTLKYGFNGSCMKNDAIARKLSVNESRVEATLRKAMQLLRQQQDVLLGICPFYGQTLAQAAEQHTVSAPSRRPVKTA